MTLKTKIATALVTGSFLAATLLPASAFAKTTVNIKNNGKDSTNRTTITNTQTSTQRQRNRSLIGTGVLSVAGTGGNTVSGNTGAGDKSVNTGGSTSKVTVDVGGSKNTGVTSQCPCSTGNTNVTISGNQQDSTNTANVTNDSSSTTAQSNGSVIITLVGSVAGVGGNTVSGNTGAGDSSITTGGASSTVEINVTGSSNTLNP